MHRSLPTAIALLTAVSLGSCCVADTSPREFRIGVSGDYPNGIDGQLSARGLPWQRVFAWEMKQPEVLARFDVLMLSCLPVAHQPEAEKALISWLEAGGRAFVETWAAQNSYPLLKFVKVTTGAPSLGDVMVTRTDHPIAVGLDPSVPVDMHNLQGVCVWPRDESAGEILGYYARNGASEHNEKWPAIVRAKVGEGEVIYSGAPLAFARFHRGNSAEPLLDGIINYLLRGEVAPKFLWTEPDNDAPPSSGERVKPGEDSGEAPPTDSASEPTEPVEPAALPDGFSFIEASADESYNIRLDIDAADAGADGPTVLVFDAEFADDGAPRRPCLWMSFSPDRVELFRGKRASGKPVATAAWEAVAGLSGYIRRRPGMVSLIMGADEVLTARITTEPGCLAMKPGAVSVGDPYIQPVAPVRFADDFMRASNSESPWTPVAGEWRQVGVGNEAYSINGFCYIGKSDAQAMATAGDWMWENYSVSVAARPDTEGAVVGVAGLMRDETDYVALLSGPEWTRIVRVLGGEEAVLAEMPGGCLHGSWHRLALRADRHELEGSIDGVSILTCANPTVRSGVTGLIVKGGTARFDDVIVQPSDELLIAPRNEGGSVAEIPPSMGPHDYMTWANPGALWSAHRVGGDLLWHAGDFLGDLDASMMVEVNDLPYERSLIASASIDAPADERVTITVAGHGANAELTLTAPGQKTTRKMVVVEPGGALALSRRGSSVRAVWAGRPIGKPATMKGPCRLAADIEGAPISVDALSATSPQVRDYVFGVAPTDWHVSHGSWEVAARWACDGRWSWLAGWGAEDAVIWNKHAVQGDVAVDYWVGTKMKAPGGPETKRCRDYNTVLCGDKASARSGYSFTIGGDGGAKTQLLRNGEVVAENADVRVPSGYNVHHRWFRVRASRIGHRVALEFEGHTVLEYEDPDPLPGGYVGLWTRNSGVLIPRVTIWSGGS